MRLTGGEERRERGVVERVPAVRVGAEHAEVGLFAAPALPLSAEVVAHRTQYGGPWGRRRGRPASGTARVSPPALRPLAGELPREAAQQVVALRPPLRFLVREQR